MKAQKQENLEHSRERERKTTTVPPLAILCRRTLAESLLLRFVEPKKRGVQVWTRRNSVVIHSELARPRAITVHSISTSNTQTDGLKHSARRVSAVTLDTYLSDSYHDNLPTLLVDLVVDGLDQYFGQCQ